MEQNKKNKRFKIIRIALTVIVIITIILASIHIFNLVTKLSTDEVYKLEFQNKIKEWGFFGVLALIGLQIVQIAIAVIPGQPIEVIAGMLYGTFLGVAVCTVGIFLGTAVIYYTIRKLGTGIMKLFFAPETIEKTQNLKIFNDTPKLETFLFIVFLIPAIPKDIFIYLGALTKIKPMKFFLIATIPRIPGLFLMTFAGDSVADGNFITTLIIVSVIIILAIFGNYINKKMTKQNEK